MNKEAWKRIPLWITIILLSGYIFVTQSDYNCMVRENKLMKQGFIEDVVGYNYCDRD